MLTTVKQPVIPISNLMILHEKGNFPLEGIYLYFDNNGWLVNNFFGKPKFKLKEYKFNSRMKDNEFF